MTRVVAWPVAMLGAAAVVVVALVVGVVAIAQLTDSDKRVARGRLPDLDQETPSQLKVREQISRGHRSYRLGFRAAIRNIGDGPLIIDGHRPETRTSATMTADQLIDTKAGSSERVTGVGELRFGRSPDHGHWHYLGFDRYELRRAGSSHVLVRDQKTSFCLGDRYRVTSLVLKNASTDPVYTSRCGLAQPDLVHVREGTSVGYGDDNSAYLEDQDLPLDGLSDGQYVLVHRVNADRRLHELSYANNASSLLIDLRWKRGVPQLRVVASCPDSARCNAPR